MKSSLGCQRLVVTFPTLIFSYTFVHVMARREMETIMHEALVKLLPRGQATVLSLPFLFAGMCRTDWESAEAQHPECTHSRGRWAGRGQRGPHLSPFSVRSPPRHLRQSFGARSGFLVEKSKILSRERKNFLMHSFVIYFRFAPPTEGKLEVVWFVTS